MRREWLPLVVVCLSLITGLYFFPRLPQQVPSLWGGSGDAYSSRGWAAFFPFVLIVVLTSLFTLMPAIEPERRRPMAAWRAHAWIRGGILVFMWWIQLVTLRAAVSPGRELILPTIAGSLGVVLFVAGVAAAELPSRWLSGFGRLLRASSQGVWTGVRRLAQAALMAAGAVLTVLSLALSGAPLLVASAGALILGVMIPAVVFFGIWVKTPKP